jgi:Sec-independent protein translocase protein TatA
LDIIIIIVIIIVMIFGEEDLVTLGSEETVTEDIV